MKQPWKRWAGGAGSAVLLFSASLAGAPPVVQGQTVVSTPATGTPGTTTTTSTAVSTSATATTTSVATATTSTTTTPTVGSTAVSTRTTTPTSSATGTAAPGSSATGTVTPAVAPALSGTGVLPSLAPSPSVAASVGLSPRGVTPSGNPFAFMPYRGSPVAAAVTASGTNMTYHGGPVEHTTDNHTIFWQPSGTYMDPNYRTLINRFFGNYDGSQIYNLMTQYSDGSGNVQDRSTFGGEYDDTATAYGSTQLSDAQVQAEVTKAINANSWPTGVGHEYFVFTSQNEDECAGSGDCFSSAFCAYHSYYTLNGQTVLYAYEPYANSPTVQPGCQAVADGNGSSPNSDVDADDTIEPMSHELAETITDPQLNAWYDTSLSGEIGDKCNFTFGPQFSNGADTYMRDYPYLIQQLWNNQLNGGQCSMSLNDNLPGGQWWDDFDEDGKTDAGIFRPSTGLWYVLLSNGGTRTQPNMGTTGDIPVTADFDGDGKADLIYWNPTTGQWFGVLSGGGLMNCYLGQNGDIPIPGDYSGAGKAGPAIFRPSTGLWYGVSNTCGAVTLDVTGLGQTNDIPIPRDYDGDGKLDVALYRPSTGLWYAVLSGGGTKSQPGFGIAGDLPEPMDYDGDGKADFTIYRPSTGQWYGLLSNGGAMNVYLGLPGDAPIPADYAGTGHAGPAIFRNNTGQWYGVNGPTGSTVTLNVQNFGQGGDDPLPQYPN